MDKVRQTWQEALQTHRRNLANDELQAARHGMNVPENISNSLDHERDEIDRLEGILGMAPPPIDPQDLRQLRRKAHEAYCKSNWEHAEKLLMQVVSLEPEDASFREMLVETQRQLETEQFCEMLQKFHREGDYRAVIKALNSTIGQQLNHADAKELCDWASECQRHEEHRASLWATGKQLLVDAEAVAADSPNSVTAREVLAHAQAMLQTIECLVGQVAISISVSRYQEPLVLK